MTERATIPSAAFEYSKAFAGIIGIACEDITPPLDVSAAQSIVKSMG